jgi:UPF0755 protein
MLFGVPVLAFGVFAFRPIQVAQISDSSQPGVLITIPAGQSLAQIAQQLDDKHVVADALAFRLLVRVRGVARSLQAGTYRFVGAHSPLAVMERLVAGQVELLSYTFPEGLTALEIGKRCAEYGLGDADTYSRLAHDSEFLRELKVSAPSLEGYLFPETYRFTPGSAEKSVLKTMVFQLRQHLDISLLSQAKSHNLDEFELLTLASIIQKEAGNNEEMPLISAVFHNRLKRGMPLQADPTVIYGISNFDGNLTRKDLLTDSPYNTYARRGLPLGPIANPGLAALAAAANPAPSNALYFVATGTGGHAFSATLAEHNRAVRRYLVQRKKSN